MYRLVAPVCVELYWPLVEPWITKAIGREDAEDDLAIIKHKAQQGVAHLWVGTKPPTEYIDFVLVTEGALLEGVPTLILRWLSAEKLDDCLKDLRLVEDWALQNGYIRLQAWGRRGWERKLRPLGFAHNFTVMDKFLTGGVH